MIVPHDNSNNEKRRLRIALKADTKRTGLSSPPLGSAFLLSSRFMVASPHYAQNTNRKTACHSSSENQPLSNHIAMKFDGGCCEVPTTHEEMLLTIGYPCQQLPKSFPMY
eukprot:5547108-Amphidinium_carterae.1